MLEFYRFCYSIGTAIFQDKNYSAFTLGSWAIYIANFTEIGSNVIKQTSLQTFLFYIISRARFPRVFGKLSYGDLETDLSNFQIRSSSLLPCV